MARPASLDVANADSPTPAATSDAGSDTERPGLLTIPQETRDNIYNHLLVSNTGVVRGGVRPYKRDTRGVGDTKIAYRALSLTCAQLNREVKEHLFDRNIIAMPLRADLNAKFHHPLARARHLALCGWLTPDFGGSRGLSERRYCMPHACVVRVDVDAQGASGSVMIDVQGSPALRRFMDWGGWGYTQDDGREEVVRTTEVMEAAVLPALAALQRASEREGRLTLVMVRRLMEAVEAGMRVAKTTA
ncbi:hypothetical protein LTR08_005557 [Meristemomyces frigidus]|nr:hypothetical protein LTR08_005557 [Meristemomyces frigidus]